MPRTPTQLIRATPVLTVPHRTAMAHHVPHCTACTASVPQGVEEYGSDPALWARLVAVYRASGEARAGAELYESKLELLNPSDPRCVCLFGFPCDCSDSFSCWSCLPGFQWEWSAACV